MIARLNSEVNAAVKTKEIAARMLSDGSEPGDMTPAQFATFFQDESTKWAKVVKAAGIKGD